MSRANPLASSSIPPSRVVDPSRHGITIRRYQDGDLDAVLAVWHRAFRIAHPFLDDAFLTRERHAIATVHLATAETWVYLRDGRVLGFIAMVGQEIGGLFVDPTVQGRGIGRALVDHARERWSPLDVEVFSSNRIGRRFYDRYGFKEVGQRVHEETGQVVLRLRIHRDAAPGADGSPGGHGA